MQHVSVVGVLIVSAMAMDARAATEVTVESPLARAARQTLAARQKAAKPRLAVITDETVANATAILTTGSGGADLPRFDEENGPVAAVPAVASPATPQPVRRAQEDGVVVLTAADSCEPRPSQNMSAAKAPSLPRLVIPESAARPAGASAGAPRQSQNAGPTRPPVPQRY